MVYIYILTMAIVTYLIRMIPLTVFRKKIKNRYIQSFLYYVPYACLMAMTFPSVLYATDNIVSAVAGVGVAIVLALFDKSLVVVALCACLTVFGCGLIF
ncbi:MAG: AzlD domain-containing protein [Lachnospiraceae bacterium]|nr:AzlD domain-containing protein [Lachnospiraceae bacterium]